MLTVNRLTLFQFSFILVVRKSQLTYRMNVFTCCRPIYAHSIGRKFETTVSLSPWVPLGKGKGGICALAFAPPWKTEKNGIYTMASKCQCQLALQHFYVKCGRSTLKITSF